MEQIGLGRQDHPKLCVNLLRGVEIEAPHRSLTICLGRIVPQGKMLIVRKMRPANKI